MDSSADLDREDEEDDRVEGHIDDHLFLHNAHMGGVQGFPSSHGVVRDGLPNLLHHN